MLAVGSGRGGEAKQARERETTASALRADNSSADELWRSPEGEPLFAIEKLRRRRLGCWRLLACTAAGWKGGPQGERDQRRQTERLRGRGGRLGSALGIASAISATWGACARSRVMSHFSAEGRYFPVATGGGAVRGSRWRDVLVHLQSAVQTGWRRVVASIVASVLAIYLGSRSIALMPRR